MSFNSMKLSELKLIAEGWGVDVPQRVNKANLIRLMEEEGLNYETYLSYVEAAEGKKEEEEKEDPARIKNIKLSSENHILVKMDRYNMSYEAMGYRFSRENPYAVVPESIAQEIFDHHDGFRPATPREVQDFYS
jgi:parvulin-like peptidyl-prolyl isomerase